MLLEDDPLIVALESGLKEHPEHVGLLTQLAMQLKVSPKHLTRAFALVEKAVIIEPNNIESLRLARDIARVLGKDQVASSYDALLETFSELLPNQDRQTLPLHRGAAEDDPAHKARVRGSHLRLVSDADTAKNLIEFEEAHVHLDDVGGMEDVKKRLHLSFLAPLKHPELMRAYGKRVRGGLLLYGPPGCGKTYMARALAGELGAKFMSIGLTDILDIYVGESEKKLHDIFEVARLEAPAVLFIDELDALGQRRSQLRRGGTRTLVNQLLAEMDSMEQHNEDLFVLAATNHPWDVDAALRRPGRFDRMIPVFPPDRKARKVILKKSLEGKPADDINFHHLVEKTEQFSGADLVHICNTAIEYALESSIDCGEIRALCQSDFKRAIRETRPSTVTWFESARNYAMFANESGSYDDLLRYIMEHKL